MLFVFQNLEVVLFVFQTLNGLAPQTVKVGYPISPLRSLFLTLNRSCICSVFVVNVFVSGHCNTFTYMVVLCVCGCVVCIWLCCVYVVVLCVCGCVVCMWLCICSTSYGLIKSTALS